MSARLMAEMKAASLNGRIVRKLKRASKAKPSTYTAVWRGQPKPACVGRSSFNGIKLK